MNSFSYNVIDSDYLENLNKENKDANKPKKYLSIYNK